MKRRTRILTITLSAAALLAVGIAQDGKKPVNWNGLPEPFHTPSANNRPRVIPRPDGSNLQVPAGFEVTEYMSGFNRPRFMLLGPSNEVILSDSGDRDEASGAVYVLQGDAKKKIIEGLDRPYGMALQGDWLYVAEPTSLKRYKYDKSAKSVTSKGEEIVSLEGFGTGHWTRSILFTPKGDKFYLTVGSGSNVDVGEDPMRAALHLYNADGSGHQTIGTGLRNIIGLRFHPGTTDIWGSVQERDGLGDDLVSDFLVNIKKGAFYGWPIAYSGPHEEPRHKGVDPAKVKSTLYPDVLLGAHVAVLDILFYTGNQFPEKYKGGMLLAFHGSWNRAERVGYRIAYIPFKDGRPQSGPQDFLTGWMTDPSSEAVWGRPVGLLQMPDGSLLISDDGGQKIWRLSYKG